MSKRIFIAVNISEEARNQVSDHIAALQNEFPQVRAGWEKREKLHLTLKFLGRTSDEQMNKVENIVSEICRQIASFRLKIQETRVFPSPKNARILWLDAVDKTKSLTEINSRLENECEKIGFVKEKRKYVPHLTIARIKQSQNAKDLIVRHLQRNFEPVEFEVFEIVIYESELQKTGSIYKIVSKHKLK